MHETGHILLGESVMHERAPYESDQRIEQWCNSFAASVLIPKKQLIAITQGVGKSEQAIWNEKEVKAVSRRFTVSPAAMIRRLERLHLIELSNFNTLRSIFDTFRPKEKNGDGGNYYNNMLARLGTLLPSMAFQGYYSGEISTRDLSSIMGTRVVHLDEMEKRVMGINYAFK
jgi:Zn-dependent peptidase ImmA (M78 family)